MRIKLDWKIVAIALLAAGWRHDLNAGRHNTRLYFEMKEKKNALVKLNLYLVEVLEKHNVPFDEFDDIAVTAILADAKK